MTSASARLDIGHDRSVCFSSIGLLKLSISVPCNDPCSRRSRRKSNIASSAPRPLQFLFDPLANDCADRVRHGVDYLSCRPSLVFAQTLGEERSATFEALCGNLDTLES